LKHIYNNTGRASARNVADAIGKSKRRTNEYLRELKEKGLICQEGGGNKIMYILTDAGKYYIENIYNF
jgi:predicted transcriptional regulator